MLGTILVLSHLLLLRFKFVKKTYVFKTDAVCLSHEGGARPRPPPAGISIWRQSGGNDEIARLYSGRIDLPECEFDIRPVCTLNCGSIRADEVEALTHSDFKNIVIRWSSILESRNDDSGLLADEVSSRPVKYYYSDGSLSKHELVVNGIVKAIMSNDQKNCVEDESSKDLSGNEVVLVFGNDSSTVIDLVVDKEEVKNDCGQISTKERNSILQDFNNLKAVLASSENSSLFIADLTIGEEVIKIENGKLSNLETHFANIGNFEDCWNSKTLPTLSDNSLSIVDLTVDGEEINTPNRKMSEDFKTPEDLLQCSDNSLSIVDLAIEEKDTKTENWQIPKFTTNHPKAINELLGFGEPELNNKNLVEEKVKLNSDLPVSRTIGDTSRARNETALSKTNILLDELYLFYDRRL